MIIKSLINLALFIALLNINAPLIAKNQIVYSDNFDQLFSLATIEASNNNKERAFSYFEAIREKFPDKTVAIYKYKDFCVKHGYYDKAIELNKFLYEKTRASSLRQELAFLYEKKGEIDNTQAVYESELAKNPDNDELKEKLVKSFYNNGNFKLASNYCKDDNNQSTAMLCARSFFYSQQNKAAQNIIETNNLGLTSDYTELEFISDVYLANREFSKAITVLEKINGIKQSPKIYLKLGDLYSTIQIFDLATKNYEKYLRFYPNSTNALNKVLSSYYALEDKQNAINVLEKLIVIDKNDFDSSLKLADLYYSLDEKEKALELYKQFHVKHPENQLVKKHIADIHFSFNRLNEAEKLYEELFKDNDQDMKLIDSIIDVKLAQNNFVEALNYINYAMWFRPDDVELKRKMVNVFFALGEPGAATRLLEELLEIDSENIILVSRLSDSYLANDETGKAIVLLNNYMKNNDSTRDLEVKLTNSYLATGQFDKASELLVSLVSKYPNDDELSLKLADTLMALELYDEAYEVICPLLNKNKQDLALTKKLANLMMILNKFEENEVLLKWAHKNNPDDDEIKKLLGDTSLYLSKFKEALEYYHSISNTNRDEGVVFGMAEANRFLKEYETAETHYDSLSDSGKYKIKALVGKGYIKVDKNKLYDAKRDFKHILELDENNFDAKLGLATTHIATEDHIAGLKILDELGNSDKVRYEKGNAYERMQMYGKAVENLQDNKLPKAQKLYQLVLNKMEFRADPEYNYTTTTFPNKEGSPGSKLKVTRYGLEFSDYPQFLGLEKTNLKFKAKYLISLYDDGFSPNKVTPTNYFELEKALQGFLSPALINSLQLGSKSRWGEVKSEALSNYYGIGIEGRPFKHLGTNNEVGLKFFDTNSSLLEAKSLWDIHINDTIKLHFGYERFNIEETLLSSAGIYPISGPFSGQLIGQAINDKFKLIGYTLRFPRAYFSYGSYSLGRVTGRSMTDNSYSEAVLGLGKVLHTRPEGALVDLVMPEYTFYYTGYDKDLFGFGGKNKFSNLIQNTLIGSDTVEPGGYFSPDYLVSNQIAMHLRGTINNLNLWYYLIGSVGVQTVAENGTDFTWGAKARLIYNKNGPYGLAVTYAIEDYNVIMKHYLMAQLLTRW